MPKIYGVSEKNIVKLAGMYVTTTIPAALKSSWGQARAFYGEQHSGMKAELYKP